MGRKVNFRYANYEFNVVGAGEHYDLPIKDGRVTRGGGQYCYLQGSTCCRSKAPEVY